MTLDLTQSYCVQSKLASGNIVAMADYAHLNLDYQLCFALYKASRAMTRAYTPLLDEAGLTYPQYLAMLALWQEPDRARSVGELGARLHLDSGTLTPLLKRLSAMGYVTRSRDAGDERRVLVSLTPAGLDLRDRLAAVPGAIMSCVGMDIPDVLELHARLTALTSSLEAVASGASGASGASAPAAASSSPGDERRGVS